VNTVMKCLFPHKSGYCISPMFCLPKEVLHEKLFIYLCKSCSYIGTRLFDLEWSERLNAVLSMRIKNILGK
jgi:hypothetical protein